MAKEDEEDSGEEPVADSRCRCSGSETWLAGGDPRIDSPRPELVGLPSRAEAVALFDDHPRFERFAPPTPPPRRRPV